MMHKMGQTTDINVNLTMGMKKKKKMLKGMKKKKKMLKGKKKMLKGKKKMLKGMMGMMVVGMKHNIKKHKGSWILLKGKDGKCECKRGIIKGKIVLGRFHGITDCEDHRSHNC